jgi:hypothetical protein
MYTFIKSCHVINFLKCLKQCGAAGSHGYRYHGTKVNAEYGEGWQMAPSDVICLEMPVSAACIKGIARPVK